MKTKIFLVLTLFVAILAMSLLLPNKNDAGEEYEYLRLHIRANSNSTIDQNIKYEIKDVLVDYLTPYLCDVESKEDAIMIINALKTYIVTICEEILSENGFEYTANVKIDNEYFPTRTYANTTLSSGYYDAVIVELGDAVGDNWWCVMYPPLCFVNNFENSVQINFKSKIVEFFKNLFD